MSNLYDILEINKTSTVADIKKSYNKLVKKWHPDRNISNNDVERKQIESKFRDIQVAYEILSDENKRKKYDNMNMAEQIEIYDSVKKYFSKNKYFGHLIDQFVGSVYDNNENELKKDIDMLNFSKIYDTFINRMSIVDINYMDEELQSLDLTSICSEDDGDISIHIYVSLDEVYMDKYKKITINRTNKSDFTCYIPSLCSIYNTDIIDNAITYKNEGNGKNSDIIITVQLRFDENMYTVSDNNIYMRYAISLHQFLYGTKNGSLQINFLNDEIITIDFNGFINTVPMHIIKNKGLPIDKPINNILRGDLIIHFQIENIENEELKNKIKYIDDIILS